MITTLAQGQDSISADTFNLTEGRWKVCTDIAYFTDYKCKNPWTNYIFDSNNTFKEIQGNQEWYGKYQFDGRSLTLKRNDERNVNFGANTYPITWIHKNLFYTKGIEGPNGPTLYTYYEKIE